MVNVSGGHVNYNGISGIYPTSLSAYIVISGVTSFQNAYLDVDASVGVVYTLSNNTVNNWVPADMIAIGPL